MPAIRVSTRVDRPAEYAYAYATDPSRFGEWQQGVVSGHLDAPGPDGSSKCVTVRKIGFAERASTSDVIRQDPPHSWQVRGIDGPIRAHVDVEVTPVDASSCTVAITLDFEGHGIGKLLVPMVVRPQARKEMEGNIAALKRNLESAT